MTDTSTPREHAQDPAEGAENPSPEQDQLQAQPQEPAEGADDSSAQAE